MSAIFELKHTGSYVRTCQRIQEVSNRIQSGDDIWIIDSKGARIGKLSIDYCRSDRVWYVKPWIGSEQDQLTEARTNDDLDEHIPAEDTNKNCMAEAILHQVDAIRTGEWK